VFGAVGGGPSGGVGAFSAGEGVAGIGHFGATDRQVSDGRDTGVEQGPSGALGGVGVTDGHAQQVTTLATADS